MLMESLQPEYSIPSDPSPQFMLRPKGMPLALGIFRPTSGWCLMLQRPQNLDP